MAYSDGREGVGGWLLAFLIEYCVAWPLFAIASNGYFLFFNAKYLATLPTLRWMLPLTIAVTAIQVVVPWLVGYRLIARRNPRSVGIAIAALWLLGPVTTAISLVSSLALAGRTIRLHTIWWTIAPIAIEVLIHAGLWTFYFLRSRRVRNTYYPERVEDELAGTFA